MKHHREVIVLLGKPGSGKGTQAAPLASALGIPAVSVGKLWRAEIKKGTAIGRAGARFVAAGKLAPNNLTAAIIKARLRHKDVARGIIFDGYPRDLVQAHLLHNIAPVTHAFLISITDREVLRRIAGRRMCALCTRNYHIEASPPRRMGVCDDCGGKLVRRDDDSPRIVRERLVSYRDETLPVLRFYRNTRVLRRVDGIGNIKEVRNRMLTVLKKADKPKQ